MITYGLVATAWRKQILTQDSKTSLLRCQGKSPRVRRGRQSFLVWEEPKKMPLVQKQQPPVGGGFLLGRKSPSGEVSWGSSGPAPCLRARRKARAASFAQAAAGSLAVARSRPVVTPTAASAPAGVAASPSASPAASTPLPGRKAQAAGRQGSARRRRAPHLQGAAWPHAASAGRGAVPHRGCWCHPPLWAPACLRWSWKRVRKCLRLSMKMYSCLRHETRGYSWIYTTCYSYVTQ